MNITCIVLAGGKAQRLGQSKVLEDVGGKNLIERVIDTLSFFKSDIIIVTSENQFLSEFANNPKIKIVTDIYPDSGPFGGIYTGIAISEAFYNLVVACDMPFLSRVLLNYMVEAADGFDVVVPRLMGNKLEPLHAVYAKSCLPYIKHHLEMGDRNIVSFFPEVRVRYIEAGEIRRFDPKHLSFFNINTEADLRMAREMVKATFN